MMKKISLYKQFHSVHSLLSLFDKNNIIVTGTSVGIIILIIFNSNNYNINIFIHLDTIIHLFK